ncbi:hypothetical protein AKJ55_01930 [candidate division MSBL1 archaeon SCGC-AAA382M17]|uniref:Uncharacterized protein n=1 Tax=candidate division MSBL1 archaeon SCGC-AAA382M17 TaxID=1698284 RepID=A0ABR5TJ32_9EURY|nr:hypothetical protein AKJ55_01930 [candidate division MSBL1 archaeon SCGC-AAA382M17]
MKDQKDLIEKRDWDCLILLDACRYDYFEDIHDNYFEGQLQKADSGASATGTWLYSNCLAFGGFNHFFVRVESLLFPGGQ